MSEPKRYAIRGFSAALVEEENGVFVRYEDYARLKAEVERLTTFATRTIIPNEELKKQVERLTKAGDAMAEICFYQEPIAVQAWLFAKTKEGKQP